MNFPASFRRCAVFGIALLLALQATPAVSAQDKVSRDQTRQIQRIKAAIDRAGRLFQNDKADEAAKLITEMAGELETLVKDANDALLAAAKPQHARLVQARKILVDGGQAVPPIADLPVPTTLAGDTVSFSADVAGILMTNCGNCHVTRARGDFSMASYAALANGLGGSPVVVPGKPDESYLVEVIEQGMMPPSGNAVAAADLAVLKQWITEGANFDRDNPAENLRAIVQEMARQAQAAANPEIAMPTGSETVSFAMDVAPVLMENCMGCHYEAQNVRGGLRMTTFRQFLRGGDSGSLVTAGDGENSPLVQRLRATDNTRMPRGRQPLEKAVIDKIVTWINEGARFDGRDPRMNLREVSAIVRSEKATHEQLAEDRAAESLKRWKKVMLDIEPVEAGTSDFLVLGTADDAILTRIGEYAQSRSAAIKKQLGLKSKQPLVKGRISLFVFERRYDYNEFGKMVEGRDLPANWKLHWGYDTVNAWIAMQVSRDGLDELKPQIQQSLAALAVAANGIEVPRWFADGTGFLIAEELVNDGKLIKQWQAAAVDAASSMKEPTDFLRNRMSDDRAALVAYGFVRSIMGKRRQFERTMKAIREGGPFGDAFSGIYSATPIELVQQSFGGEGGGNRRRK